MRPNLPVQPGIDTTRKHAQAINFLLNRYNYIHLKIDGMPVDAQSIVSTRFPVDLTISPDATLAQAEAASTGTADWEFFIEGVPVGQVSFAASGTGILTLTQTKIARGELFEITAPSPQDATLADITLAIPVAR